MAYAKGAIPLTLLRTVAPNTRLLNPVAVAYTNLVLIADMLDGTTVRPAGPYGAGYRDWATAMVFWRAGQGDPDAKRRAGIDQSMRVSIAYPPGSHGSGDRIDLLFDGRSPDANDLTLAARYGFTREFGAQDANHFMHDRRTAISGVRNVDRLRLVARSYNGKPYGRDSATASTGRVDSDFIWLAQHHGHQVGTYPKTAREDGISGPLTERAISLEWSRLKAVHARNS